MKPRIALKSLVGGLCGSLAPIAALVLLAAPAAANDYPTAARADYVFGCMASNGQTQEMLNRCACSIDVIASLLPYERYVEAETVVRMRQVGGEKTVMFRDSAVAKETLAELRRAQAEAEIRCF
ncbi:MAG: hypothetical protein MI785_06205 [Kiloniellales bacterium]|nr:hypothetical protein [Kiloniellales bacterium]